MPGRLYLVPTPIGNLGDISQRMARTLAQADFIAAEDTRVTVKLLNHLGLKKSMVAYHRHNTQAGGRAVLVWAWNALHTERFACDVFRAGYGLDLGDLLGRTCTEEVRRSEAVRETLLVNPYILDVSQVSVDFDGSWLRLGFRLKTIYGEVSMDGCDITV